MCGHHCVQHGENVGALLPSLLHCLGGASHAGEDAEDNQYLFIIIIIFNGIIMVYKECLLISTSLSGSHLSFYRVSKKMSLSEFVVIAASAA